MRCSSAAAASTAPARVWARTSTRSSSWRRLGPSTTRDSAPLAAAVPRTSAAATGSRTMPMAMARKAWPHESTLKRPSSVGSESGSAHQKAGMETSPKEADHAVTTMTKSAMPTGSSSRCQPRSFHVEGSEKSALRRAQELAVRRPVDAGDRLAQHERRAAALDPGHPARGVDGDHRDRQPDERDGQAEGERPARDHDREGEDAHRQREQQVDGVESELAKQGAGTMEREHVPMVGVAVIAPWR